MELACEWLCSWSVETSKSSKIPTRALDFLRGRAGSVGGPVVVAAAKRIQQSAIQAGDYAHLGIIIDTDGAVKFDLKTTPLPALGRYSRRNIEGHHITRRDLPKVLRSWSWIYPYFGDWGKGSGIGTTTKEVYQTQFIPPDEAEIDIELINEVGNEYVFRFAVDRSIDPAHSGSEDVALRFMNLLQENIGAADIFAGEASVEDYLASARVSWELIPVGAKREVLERLFSRPGKFDAEAKVRASERFDLLQSLRPISWISGSSGFQRYFGARFSENLVVFENLSYGNAIYIMPAGWEEMSRLSRGDLMDRHSSQVIRLIHRNGWQGRLERIVAERR
ncbi:hypothetical protein HMPREF9946_01546 [Acetobacteraceae bacterium AT-5844]|nr:hypothetical protein HMPREF9946_01546 [Acetobacteraceae bacterium AT-5844]